MTFGEFPLLKTNLMSSANDGTTDVRQQTADPSTSLRTGGRPETINVHGD